MTELFFLQGEDSFFLTRGKLRRIYPREQNLPRFADRGGSECRLSAFLTPGKLRRIYPREQNLPRFADRGGSECKLSPIGIVYEKIGRKMIPGYAERPKTDLCDRA